MLELYFTVEHLHQCKQTILDGVFFQQPYLVCHGEGHRRTYIVHGDNRIADIVECELRVIRNVVTAVNVFLCHQLHVVNCR